MYLVYSLDKWQANVITPAGSYENIDDAKRHAESVTYQMVVVDSKAECRGFIYTNWPEVVPVITAIKRRCAYGDCTLIATYDDRTESVLFSFYVDELAFSDSELIGLSETQARNLRHNRDVAYLRS